MNKYSNEPLLKVEVKDCFRTEYKAKVLASNKKELAEILKTLSSYGFKVVEACGDMIQEEDKKKWIED